MFRTASHSPRALIIGVVAILGLSLGACSGGDPSESNPSDDGTAADGTTVTTTGATDGDTSNVAAGGDFCAAVLASADAAGQMESDTNDLNDVLRDPSALTSGDMTGIHAQSQAILDSAKVTAAFYETGAATADDPAAKEAFLGMSSFVNQYSIPLAEAGLEADSLLEYSASLTTLLSDPNLQTLLQQVSGWAVTVSDYTQKKCGYGMSSDS